ncbi:MAG: type I-C CRISPR-associated protein Cas8c/Csd1 [Desulfovibrio sp.]|nr:type I-C CRISPR-associated protein Cas8c/Csd1 [Desulfovibrio sp.]
MSELCRFYDRLAADPASGMPPVGMTSEQISFALVIDREGNLVDMQDLRDSKGKAQRLMVPAAVSRQGNAVANFLWDKTGFVLGVGKGKTDLNAKYHAAFKELHEGLLADVESPHARALLAFLRAWVPEDFATHAEMRDKREALLDSNVVFRLDSDKVDHYLHEEPALREVWLTSLAGGGDESGPRGVCLVTGVPGPVARTHPKVKGVIGAQGSGASLISFDCAAFRSYGKEQSANAPVSESAARAYTTALNFLLQREHQQTLRIGDTSMVFWADRPTPAEKVICRFFSPVPRPEAEKGKADPAEAKQDRAQLARVRGILMALRRGESLNEADKELDAGATFYILGLAPNVGRLSVRFWLTKKLGPLLGHISRWYEDLDIERQKPDTEPEFPPLWLLIVRSLAAQGKSENVPPELAGQLARCVLSGGPVPENVFAAILQRIHADKEVDYYRAALIKAFLCRKPSTEKEELPMPALNKDDQNIGYRLGRAFALLEKAQKDALGGDINASLRERYIGAASATPRLVFPLLLRLTQHHVTKASKKPRLAGYDVRFTRNMGEVLGDVTDFPAILSLADQGRFMLGYYHQTTEMYRKKDVPKGAETPEQTENPEAAE